VKALVVGYGSIGQRHCNVLQSLGLGVAVVSRQALDQPPQFPTLEEGVHAFSPDYVVVANPTSEHLASLTALVRLGFRGKVLVEKPLFVAPAAIPAHAFESLFVGYNLRFHPLMTELRRRITVSPAIAAHVYTGQWLPAWRPGQDYRTTYSARKAQGGGVLRDLSHDLDYLCWLLGPPAHGCALLGKVSDLETDTEDYCSLLFQSKCGALATLHVNYLDHPARRECVIHTRKNSCKADFITGMLACGGDTQSFEIERNQTYADMHRAVLDGDHAGQLCDAEQGLRVVKLIAAFEKSSSTRSWMAPL
jgi:predicted dehydrogenase